LNKQAPKQIITARLRKQRDRPNIMASTYAKSHAIDVRDNIDKCDDDTVGTMQAKDQVG
jgi:hypothetical protein